MILAIDCGNAHIAFGCMDEKTLAPVQGSTVFRIPTDRAETDFGYTVKIRQVLEIHKIQPEKIGGAVISCVVPPLTAVLSRAVRMMIGQDALIVGAGVKTGLHICINDPGTLASDLVATAVAAKEEYPLPCVIVDLGTATTITMVDGQGRYIGGAILPGTGISLNALSETTSLLPYIEMQTPARVIGSNTVDAMKSGILYGSAGAIDGILERMEKERGEQPASIVATGGLSGKVCPLCTHSMTVDPTLLLRGLVRIYNKNR